MTKDDVLFGYRQALFAEAARTSVSESLRRGGRDGRAGACDGERLDWLVAEIEAGEAVP